MGWENRNGKQYYYRKIWRNGTCVSEYVPVAIAEPIAQLLEVERAEKDLERLRRAKFTREQARIDEQLDEMTATVRAVVTIALVATGWHQHKRQWRQWRNAPMTKSAKPKSLPTAAELRAMVNRLDKTKPAKADVELFRSLLDDVPSLWRVVGDVPKQTRLSIIEQAAGKSKSLALSLEKGCEAIAADLGRDDAPALEQLLIDQVVTCWVRHNCLENVYQQRQKTVMPLGTASYWERKLTASQNRFLRACESLARVRRYTARTLALQVNIAGQQVNVAQQ